MTTTRPILPNASPTGNAVCAEGVDLDAEGMVDTTAAQPMMARDSSPPSGNPTNTFTREVIRSFAVQPSSTPPEEKKNTSYGVIAAANSDIAKNP